LSGEFRLGSVGSVLTGLLPPVLAKLREEFPGLHVSLTSGFTEDLVAAVRSARLDAAIVSDFGTSGSDLVCREFMKEPLVFVAPGDAPDEPVHTLIRQYPFIRYAPDASMGRIIDTAIRAAKLRVNEQMRLDWIEAIEAMVANGLGVSVIPQRSVGGQSRQGLRAMAFGKEVRYRTLFLVEKRDQRRGQFCDVLVDRLTSAGRT
jgi:DNA-binding transcriptional LysR family regulator